MSVLAIMLSREESAQRIPEQLRRAGRALALTIKGGRDLRQMSRRAWWQGLRRRERKCSPYWFAQQHKIASNGDGRVRP